MSRKSRRKKKRRQPPPRQLPWNWLALAGVGLVLIVGLVVWQPWSGDDAPTATSTPVVAGAPRLWVERDTLDAGYQNYNTRIRTTFRLKNVGDQPLAVLENPQVKLVEGC